MNQNNIKPQELRLTNRVEQGEIIEIKQRTVRVRYELDGKERTSLILHEDLKPIPLSEEVLLKAGFEKRINEMQIDGIEMRLQVSGNEPDGTWFSSCGKLGGGLVVLVICKGNYVCNNIEYLHQLMNLFYSLTGEELEVRWN